jgi:hypothetical protein
MRMPSARRIRLIGIIGMMLMAVGCTATSVVTFRAPPGSVMFVDGQPYHIPGPIELTRPAGADGSIRHDISLIATVASKELRAKGYIDMFGFTESDLDKIAPNICDLQEGLLANLFEGKTLVFKGQSASRQPLYNLTLSQEAPKAN